MNKLAFREAVLADIPRLQTIRNAVKENRLSDPALVPDRDYEEFMFRRGKGWVGVVDGLVAGFAIADLQENNIWALFVHPGFEGMGIGRGLHDRMLSWYFSQGKKEVWLSTAPGTRAESFYRLCGWRENGLYGKGEIRFEMTAADYISRSLRKD